MTWRYTVLSKSHFSGGLFLRVATFMDELSNPKSDKHEENTKKIRKKDEENTKDTRNFAYFSSKQRTESSGENSQLIYEKSVV